ncbi:MAG TPA: helix-turn-helix domain-containing protein [Actinomycetota bacterium]|nr:helix-turn-helix domain-containing protein [Actinomycetota bacterium]
MEPSSRPEDDLSPALDFCRALARTLGPPFRVSLYELRPPRRVDSWGRPARARGRGGADPVLPLLAFGEPVVNRSVGGGTRISVLPLPGPEPGDGLAVAIEVDTAALSRAARLLASLAEPDGAEPQPPTDHLGDALDRMLDAAADAVGVPVEEMSRRQKQQVVRYLDERGAFLIKKAVERVAARLGVSRFTIYNYLDESNRAEPRPGEGGP